MAVSYTHLDVYKRQHYCRVKLRIHCGYSRPSIHRQVLLDHCRKNEVRFKNNYPGKDWAEGFMKRHKAVLTQRTVKNISHSRAPTDEEVVNNCFANLEQELSRIPPTNIYNYDETNLVNDPGAWKIITKRGTKYPERIQNS